MSFWKKIFGKEADPPASNRPVSVRPDADAAETLAWIRKHLAQAQVTDEVVTHDAREARARVSRLLEAQRSLAAAKSRAGGVTPAGLSFWGLFVTAELAPSVLESVPAEVDEAIAQWRAALERVHADVGRTFFAEVAHDLGFTIVGVVQRRGPRRYSFDATPESPEEWDEVLKSVTDYVKVGREKGSADQYSEAGGHEGSVVSLRVWTDYDGPDPNDVLKASLTQPGIGELRELTLGLWGAEGDAEYHDGIAILAESAGSLPKLESLFIGDFQFPDESEISWTTVGDVSRLWNAFPSLKSLRLRGGGIDLGEVRHEQLESLIVETGGLPAESVQALAAGRLPRLTHFEVWFGDSSYGGDACIDDFRAFFEGEATPLVVSLGLKNAEFSDDLAEALCNSKLCGQLVVLDLGMGTLSDRGARALAVHAEKFSALARLVLDHCYVSEEGADALRRAFGERLELGEILEPEDDESGMYVSVGE